MSEAAGSLPVGDPAGSRFSSGLAERLLGDACRAVGLASGGARMIRLGENAIFALAGAPVVARVARGDGRRAVAEKEVAVSRWLEAAGVPAARAVRGIQQPVMVGDHPVTFWELIETTGPEPTYDDLGRLLRRVHELPKPTEFELPPQRPLDRTRDRIEAAVGLSDGDREFLLGREADLRGRLAGLVFPTRPSPVHGDAHIENLMRERDGGIRLIDFEGFAFGQREWDLAVSGVEYLSARWVTDEQYRQFVDGYGTDITAWSGFEVLRDVQELNMTTWLSQNVHEGPHVAEEFERRLRSLRDDTSRRVWRPF
ncbi:MAG: hypothetical protein QG597_2482 [Actinomycetota bacterium]|nr:hypothetical protein [Actinomycetota bacterium]